MIIEHPIHRNEQVLEASDGQETPRMYPVPPRNSHLWKYWWTSFLRESWE